MDLRKGLREMNHRLSLREALRLAEISLAVVVVLFGVALAMALAGPSGWSGPARATALVFVLIGLLAPGVGWLKRRDSRELATALDRELGFPDSTLAALELGRNPSETHQAWARFVTQDFEKRLSHARLPQKRELRTLALRAVGFGVLVAAVVLWVPEVRTSGQPPIADGEAAGTVSALIAELEQFAGEHPGPSAEEFLRVAEALRARSRDDALTREDILVEIGHSDERLQALRKEGSLPDLTLLAKALEGSTDPLAEAISRGDHAAAIEQARAAFDDPTASVAAARFADLARRLEAASHSTAATAVRALAQSGDEADRAEALAALEAALGGEASARIARKELELALMQLAATRQSISNSASRGGRDPEPKPDAKEPGSPGSGAGSDTPPRLTDGSPANESPSVILPLSGQTETSGESLFSVLASSTGPDESPQTRPAESAPTATRLSSEAIGDESLPPALRTTVRRYFESIRPQHSQP